MTNLKVSTTATNQSEVLNADETIAAVCRYFCSGFPPSKIAALMKMDYGIEMTREAPYKFIQRAASKGWLRFTAQRENELTQKLQKKFGWLLGVEVVHTASFDDVASRTAALILDLLHAHRSNPAQRKNEVHIGFAGGNSMRAVSAKLAELLNQAVDGLPATLVFHSLVAGFDIEQPGTDPNSFFTYFKGHKPEESERPEIKFVLLHAPAIVKPGQMQELISLPGVHRASEQIQRLDIIVTSAGWLDDRHSMLYRYYEPDPHEMIKMLRRDGCVGDMLWLPLGKKGPIDHKRYPYRAMTLIELEELPGHIRRGAQIVLSVGPCGLCNEPKPEILKTILSLQEHLITHLVVDSRTARRVIE